MTDRVVPHAKAIGAETYKGMPGFKDGMEAEALEHNRAAIQTKMDEGYRILDIGPDFARRASEGRASKAYEMERMMTKEYAGYEKAFERPEQTTLKAEP